LEVTKQALDVEAGDVVIVSGNHELVHGVFFNDEGCTITFDRVHCLESVHIPVFETVMVVGKW
jgi:hypothetical protein